MKKRILKILLFLLVSVLLFTACGSNSNLTASKSINDRQGVTTENQAVEKNTSQNNISGANSNTEKKTVTLALAQESNELSGIWRLADKKKYIEEELGKVGYQLEVLGFAAAGPAVNEAFVSGKIDLAYYGNLPPVVLKSKGIDVSIVSIGDSQVNFSVIVPAHSDIKTIKDLEGKKVIVGRGTILDEYWGNLVKTYGIDVSKVKIINDVANANSTFVSGNADAYVIVDSAAHLINKQFPIKFIESTATSHPEFASQIVLAAAGRFAKEHPEVITAMLKAYIRAYDYAVENREEAVQTFASNSTPIDIVEKIYSKESNFSNLDGDIEEADKARLIKLNQFLLEHNYIEKSADINTLIDSSFFEQAKKELGK